MNRDSARRAKYPEDGGSAIVPRGVFRALRRAAIEANGTSIGAWRSPVSALVWETRGRRFKSSRSDHFYRYFNTMFTVQRSAIVPARDPATIKRDRADREQGTIDPPQALPTWVGVRLAVLRACFFGRG